jgi:arylsulfatase A-like enzyme
VSILTGLLPPEHRVRDNIGYHLDGKAHPSLPRVLKARGYATGAAVSAFVLRSATGLGESFDFYDDRIEAPEHSEAASQVQRAGGVTASAALAWVDRVRAKPFFLFLHLYEPHSPYTPPEPFASRYPLAYDGEIAAADAIVGDVLARLKA